MSTIVHFHIDADDVERARKFYRELFGWKFTSLPGPVPYELIATSDLQGNKGTGGGMSIREGERQGIINYFGVSAIRSATEEVVKLGGQLITPPQEIPGWGMLAVCMDTEGNRFGLFEESKASMA